MGRQPGQNHRNCRDYLPLRPLRFRLPSALPGFFIDLDILADTPVASRLDSAIPRFSPTAINGKVINPKASRMIRSRRGRYSNRTL